MEPGKYGGKFWLETGGAEKVFLNPGNIEIDDKEERVWIGAWCLLDASHGKISIGKGSVLSSGVMVYTHDNSQVPGGGEPRIGDVAIGRNVFIGSNAVVEPDVVIGDGAQIGALSLVRRGSRLVEKGLYAGCPARLVKSKKSEEVDTLRTSDNSGGMKWIK